MPSDKLIQAARRNGRRSRGPKTASGKRKSSANSRKHGLFSKHLVPDPQTELDRVALIRMISADYQPTTPFQCLIIDQIGLALARRNWALRTSSVLINEALAAQPETGESLEIRVVRAHAKCNAALNVLFKLERRFTREYLELRNQFAIEEEDAREKRKNEETDRILFGSGAAEKNKKERNEPDSQGERPVTQPAAAGAAGAESTPIPIPSTPDDNPGPNWYHSDAKGTS